MRIFLEQFYVHIYIEQKVQRFPMFFLSQICIVNVTGLHQLTSSTRVVRLLQLVNLHLHIIITPSPHLTLGLTLGVVHSMDLEWSITCTHHYSKIQSIFTALKTLSTQHIHPFLPYKPWQLLMYLLSSKFCLFFRVSQSSNHTVCSLFRLTFFHLVIHI